MDAESELIIDLCCGYGRFTENEISIDVDAKVRPTIVADVRYLPLRPNLNPEFCHASPPCTINSKARYWRYGKPTWPEVAEYLEILAACCRAFEYLGAKTATLENPPGIILEKTLGEPTVSFTYEVKEANKGDYVMKKRAWFYSNNKALARARIPPDVKQALLEKAFET